MATNTTAKRAKAKAAEQAPEDAAEITPEPATEDAPESVTLPPAGFVGIGLRMAQPDEKGYLARHSGRVDVTLKGVEREALRHLTAGMIEHGETLDDGRPVRNPNDCIRRIMQMFGGQLPNLG